MAKIELASEYSGHPGVLVQRVFNMYYERTPQGPTPSIRLPRLGLVSALELGLGPIRCTFDWLGHRIVVSGVQVYYDGSLLTGNIPGFDLCRFALSEDEIVIVASGKAYTVTGTNVTQITDPDIFMNVVDVVLLAGRFVYFDGDSSRFQWSDVGDATTIDGLSFATADENSSRVLRAAFVLLDDIVMFMDGATEWWSAADSGDDPYQRSPGRKYSTGIAARATTVLADNTIFFLGSDRKVYRASSVPVRVSSHDVEDVIDQLSETELVQCSAISVEFKGHLFYLLNLPGHGTFVLDISTGKWFEWGSYGRDRFRVSVAGDGLFGDAFTGKLFRFSPSSYYDLDEVIQKIVSVYLPLNSGYARMSNMYLQTARGVGVATGQGSDPVVEMRYSDNDGSDFTPWMVAPLGTQGDKKDTAKAVWTQLGAARAPGRLVEFRCSDPVLFAPQLVTFNERLP